MTDDIAISHLQRRKIEGRVLIPFIAACREKFGDGPTREVVAAAIRSMAVGDGERWADTFGGDLAGLRLLGGFRDECCRACCCAFQKTATVDRTLLHGCASGIISR